MTPIDCLASGFFHAIGALLGLVAFSFALTGVYLFCVGVISVISPGPQISEYHLHSDSEDSGAEEHNGHDRYNRD